MKRTSRFQKLLVVAGCAALIGAVDVGVSQADLFTDAAKATVIAPLTITKTADLSFGALVAGTDISTVSIAAVDNARSKTGTVAYAVGSLAAAGNAASFSLTGQGAATYAITLELGSITVTSGSDTMTVSGFSSSPTPTGALVAGVGTLKVGGTLNMAAGQAAGDYKGSFNVTVNYN
jgi:hypothetical protein